MTLPSVSVREGEDLSLLTGEMGAAVLRHALDPGVALRSCRVHSQHHRPGAGVSVGYAVTLEEPQVGGGIRLREAYMCASTARLSEDTPIRRVYMNGGEVGIWEFPFDPELPALATACSPLRLSALLGEHVGVELLGYRPTRRAVVRVGRSEGIAFAKVVRPSQLADLAQRYRSLAKASIPAPSLLHCEEDGLLVTTSVKGISLANVISRGMGNQTSAYFRALWHILEALPDDLMAFRRRPAWSERVEHYAYAAATVLPEYAAECEGIARDVAELMEDSDPGMLVPVHGDFYEANVFVSPHQGRVSGVIDVDSIGPGYRVDDLACMLGHISVLPHLAPTSYPHVREELPVWIRLAEKKTDPVALNARCAGVVLSLVAGAKRQGDAVWREDACARLATAQAWVARARSWQRSSARTS